MRKRQSVRKIFRDLTIELAERDSKFLVIGIDGGGLFQEMLDSYPERIIDVGIAEQAAINVAAGLSSEGRKVFISSIASFIVRRAYEQIRINVNRAEQNIVIIGYGSGLTYGEMGPTHHCIEDVALMRQLDNVTIYIPSDINQLYNMMNTVLDRQGPSYIKLPNMIDLCDYYENAIIVREEKFDVLTPDKKNLIITYGSTLHTCLNIVQKLKNHQIDIGLINYHTINSKKDKELIKYLKQADYVFTIEEHAVNGGIGTMISEYITDNNLNLNLCRHGVGNDKPFPGYNYERLLNQYKLDEKSLTKYISDKLRTN